MAKTTRKLSGTTAQRDEAQIKTKKDLICSIVKKKTKQKFLSENQKIYYDTLLNNQITICSGPAGVGKSYVAMKCAIDLLSDPLTPFEKIIIVRPAVEAEEKLGSLPGGVEEKLDPRTRRKSILEGISVWNSMTKRQLVSELLPKYKL